MSRVRPVPFDPGAERPMPPRPSTLYAQDGHLDGELLKLETDLELHAEEIARRSGATSTQAEVLEALRREAVAAADRFRTVPWDAKGNAADGLRDEEYRANVQRRLDLRQRVDFAAAGLRDRSRERAVVEAPGAREELFWIVAILGIAGVGFSVGASLHDAVLVHTFAEPARALAVSVAVGLVLAAGSVLGMLFSALHPQPKDGWEARGWLALGLLFGLAVYLLRAWLAQSTEEQLLALGFAGMELVSVLCVKLYAISLHRAVLERRRVAMERSAADAQVEEARREHEASQAELALVERKLEAHVRDVELRELRHRLVEQVRQAAASAAEVGYARGIAANRGQVFAADTVVPQAKPPPVAK